MKYTGKCKQMADQFRKDGADEYTIEKIHPAGNGNR